MSAETKTKEESAYDSDADEDYNPELILAKNKQQNDESSDDSFNSEDDVDLHAAGVKSSVKTRRQRMQDAENEHEMQMLNKYGNILLQESAPSELERSKMDDIFEKLNKITHKIYKKTPVDFKVDILNNVSENKLENILHYSQNFSTLKSPEMITIKRTYKFAGKIVTEDMTVPKDSAMGKEYLQNLKFNGDKVPVEISKIQVTETEDENSKHNDSNGLRKPLKRKSILLDIINGNNSKYTKISTLDKSKMDWANYVDSQRDMKENLESGWKGQKGGYLERKKFLEGKDLANN